MKVGDKVRAKRLITNTSCSFVWAQAGETCTVHEMPNLKLGSKPMIIVVGEKSKVKFGALAEDFEVL